MADPTTDLWARLREEADDCYSWSNGPRDTYAEHTHSYEKVLYCVDGSITFTLSDREVHLGPGDRMLLPPGTVHAAVVGPNGCTCIEGRGRNMASR
jgi:mannose-6-phosphate isomerase-like protein (cupin superfamily)